MHGRDPTANFRDDPFIYQHFQNRYGIANVTYMQGSTAAADGSSAAGFDVVFISSTMGSGDTRNKYEDSPVGIVFDEGALVHDNNIGNYHAFGQQQQSRCHPFHSGEEIHQYRGPDSSAGGRFERSGHGVQHNTDRHLLVATRPRATRAGCHARRGNIIGCGQVRGVSGDYSNNSIVDAADYVIYRKNEGGGTALMNDNGMALPVGAAHYNLWRSRFGNSSRRKRWLPACHPGC